MDYDLPEFDRRPLHKVRGYLQSVFSDKLVDLETFPDGHFRAIFHKSFFVLQGDSKKPSRSQWNTLKKRMKRRDRQVFIFKEKSNSPAEAEQEGEDCYTIDFGFFLY